MTAPIDSGAVPDVEGLPGEKTLGEYARLCADIELAMSSARSKVEEWDRAQDPHGWWHERPDWIALHNEVVTLRRAIGQMESIIDDEWGVLSDDDHFPLPDETWETVKRVRATEQL